jgi:hypothetical protein
LNINFLNLKKNKEQLKKETKKYKTESEKTNEKKKINGLGPSPVRGCSALGSHRTVLHVGSFQSFRGGAGGRPDWAPPSLRGALAYREP